jgi:hypothetical protein
MVQSVREGLGYPERIVEMFSKICEGTFPNLSGLTQ